MPKKELLDKLRKGLLAYDTEALDKAAEEAINEGIVLEAIDTLTNTIQEVGDKFGMGEIFLPELMMAGDAMKAGMAVLMPAIPKGAEVPMLGTIVIGTVMGDIHDIGKTIVGTLLQAAGFNVVDIGVDIPPRDFVKAVRENNAVIVGVSALMATTIPVQKDMVEYFEATGLRKTCKIMVGGGACTREWAEAIGADGYGENAGEAIKVAKKLVQNNK